MPIRNLAICWPRVRRTWKIQHSAPVGSIVSIVASFPYHQLWFLQGSAPARLAKAALASRSVPVADLGNRHSRLEMVRLTEPDISRETERRRLVESELRPAPGHAVYPVGRQKVCPTGMEDVLDPLLSDANHPVVGSR
jgi:hypothetical protein